MLGALAVVFPEEVAGGGGGGNHGLKNGCAAGAAGGLPGAAVDPLPWFCAEEGRPGAGKEFWGLSPRIMLDIWSIHRRDSGFDLYAYELIGYNGKSFDIHHLAEALALKNLPNLWSHGLQLWACCDNLLQDIGIRHHTGHLLEELWIVE